MDEKFIRKYFRLAKQVGEDKNPCYSRKIGTIIVHPVENRILGTGYNGPPKRVFHCDHPEHLSVIVWPQLTEEEKKTSQTNTKDEFVRRYEGCGVCPRRIVGARSGDRLELCSCAHSEANAIINSAQSVYGSWMFCWCGCPCTECSKLIVNAGIATVCFLSRYPGGQPGAGSDFDFSGRQLLTWGGVRIIEMDYDDIPK